MSPEKNDPTKRSWVAAEYYKSLSIRRTPAGNFLLCGVPKRGKYDHSFTLAREDVLMLLSHHLELARLRRKSPSRRPGRACPCITRTWRQPRAPCGLAGSARPWAAGTGSKDNSHTTSISRRRAASSNFSRSCRCDAPEPTSFTCRAIVQPRRTAYSRRARLCNGTVCWSFVETRAQRPARNIFADPARF
jgi:hypothetical protein